MFNARLAAPLESFDRGRLRAFGGGDRLAGGFALGYFYGLSVNREQPVDISATIERLGYHPQDDAFALARRRPWRQRARRWAGRVWRAATQF